jgi:hypothetical protein
VAKQAALVWIARISGVFSIMVGIRVLPKWLHRKTVTLIPHFSLCIQGSLYILFDILSQRKKKLDKTYPQLMLAIAIFDIINSTA